MLQGFSVGGLTYAICPIFITCRGHISLVLILRLLYNAHLLIVILMLVKNSLSVAPSNLSYRPWLFSLLLDDTTFSLNGYGQHAWRRWWRSNRTIPPGAVVLRDADMYKVVDGRDRYDLDSGSMSHHHAFSVIL